MKEWKSVFREGLFNNKVAIVTGGGTGIGYSISKELAILGCIVIIASRNSTKCQEAAQTINSQLPKSKSKGKVIATPLSTNIRNEQDVIDLVSFVVSTYKSIDYLINNAGGQFVCPADDLSHKGFKAVIETNLVGTFLMCREAYNQYMKDAKNITSGGSHGNSSCAIVNITLGNRNGMPCMAHSGAARSGIENMTATLCNEWMEAGVRINCVRPGIIFTESGFENYGPMGDAFVEKILPSIPSKRFGSPEEISSAVTWLLCDGASYVTGAILCVDGGSAYHFLPLIDIENECHLPVYGTLPKKAML